MRKRSLYVIFVILVTVIAASGFLFEADGVDTAPVYTVVPMADPLTALQEDSLALGVDISNAEIEEDHLQWCIASTDEFEIRRLKGSGYFTYIRKDTEWINYEKRKRTG